MSSLTHSQTLTRKRKAETDSEVLRAETQECRLQLDDLDGGGPISHVLSFLDGVSLIDFADTHPRPHQLVFGSSIKYFQELKSKLSIRECLDILGKLLSKQNRGRQHGVTIFHIIARLLDLFLDTAEDHAVVLLPRVDLFVENLEWCSDRLEQDQDRSWAVLLVNLTVLFFAVVPASRNYDTFWERYSRLNGIPLLVSSMRRLMGDPGFQVPIVSHLFGGEADFQKCGLEVLSKLASYTRATTDEAILDSDIFQWIQACGERWPDNCSLSEHAWQLIFYLMKPSSDGNRAASHQDEVKKQLIENGLMPYMVASMRSSTTITSKGMLRKLLLLYRLLTPSQHSTQIQQSFLSSGGVEVLAEVIGRLQEVEDESLVLWIRRQVSLIHQRIIEEQGEG